MSVLPMPSLLTAKRQKNSLMNFEQLFSRTISITQNVAQNMTQDIKRFTTKKLIGGSLVDLLLEQQRAMIPDSTPRLLTRSIEYIEKHIDEIGIYRLSGSTREVQEIRERYEQQLDITFEYEDVNSVCSLLKMFIRELPDCLLTGELLPKFTGLFEQYNEMDLYFGDDIHLESNHFLVQNESLLQGLKELIEQLPAPNRDFLSVFLPHLKRIAENYKVNKMGYTNLQVVFAPTLQFGGALFVVLILHCAVLFPIRQVQYLLPEKQAMFRRGPELPIQVPVRTISKTQTMNRGGQISPPPRQQSMNIFPLPPLTVNTSVAPHGDLPKGDGLPTSPNTNDNEDSFADTMVIPERIDSSVLPRIDTGPVFTDFEFLLATPPPKPPRNRE